jgi:probable rRNA maturation factor
MTLAVAVQYGTRRPWVPTQAKLRRWARAAYGRRALWAELSLRIVTPSESRHLNLRYRGKDQPTNVLSFPAEAPGRLRPCPLGDLVICASVVAAEARQQHKPLPAHWAHMIVHGVLHLLGADHVVPAAATAMERRERAILRRLGIPDPYVVD